MCVRLGVVGDGFGEFGLAAQAAVVGAAGSSADAVAGATGTVGIARSLQSSSRDGGASAYCPAASVGGGSTRRLKLASA